MYRDVRNQMNESPGMRDSTWTRSALIEELLDARHVARLGQCELQQHTGLGGVQVARGHEAQPVVVNFMIAQHDG